MEGQSKQQCAKEVSMLQTTSSGNFITFKVEEWLRSIAALNPGIQARKAGSNLMRRVLCQHKPTRRIQHESGGILLSSRTWVTACTTASHPILTATPTCRGVRIRRASGWTDLDRHLKTSCHSTSPITLYYRMITSSLLVTG